MFKLTEDYNKIKTELETIKIIDQFAIFECFNDDIFTYGFHDNETYHEFSMICDDTMLREMKILDLMELKRLTFFCHKVFLSDSNGNKEIETVVSWVYDAMCSNN